MNKTKKIVSLSVILLALLLDLGCAPAANETATYNNQNKDEISAKVIYGTDGRLDYYQVTDERIKNLAQSTVALIESSSLSVKGNTTLISGSTFQQSQLLCSTEKFKDQQAGAFCSGSLVGEDVIMTAGHCITSVSDCANTKFVFGYTLTSAQALYTTVASQDVYSCASIINRKLESSGIDYALIKLDRKVTDRKVLPIRRTGEVQIGDQLIVIGHPSGLPTKITTGGAVRKIANSGYFTANTDTYGGNSGSAVFNANTGLIEGILVRGDADYVYRGNCRVSNVCTDEGCRGEDITRVSVLKDLIADSTPVVVDPPVVVVPSVFSSASGQVSIPDNSSKGIISEISVNEIPNGRTVSVAVDIKHSYIGDLVVKVISPSGKVVMLHSRAGGSKDDIRKTYFVTSSLGAEKTTGVYKLSVQDLSKRDVGVLRAWSLVFK